MIELECSLIIVATADPLFFGFHSRRTLGMGEHVALLKERHLPIPQLNPAATILIQNERKLEPVSL